MSTAVSYRRAESVEEACAVLADRGGEARLVSGGTALAILMRQGLVRPDLLIGIGRIARLRQIDVGAAVPMGRAGNHPGESLRLGAAVPMRVAENHPAILERWPVLAETLRHVATPRIRNMATIGGGLAHADPAQDPPVTLIALGARVLVAGPRSERTKHLAGPGAERAIPIADFFVDYYETALQPAEMIVGVEVPALQDGTGAAFLKFTPRSVEDYATVSACALVRLDHDGVCRAARLVLGAVGAVPIVVDVAAALVGAEITEERARAAAELAHAAVDPLDDVRGSAEYKRDMAVVFARRALVAANRKAHRTTPAGTPSGERC